MWVKITLVVYKRQSALPSHFHVDCLSGRGGIPEALRIVLTENRKSVRVSSVSRKWYEGKNGHVLSRITRDCCDMTFVRKIWYNFSCLRCIPFQD